ncbi:hypothetical protein HYE68_007430 [Fusarium pseudograminearum]|nr:hypothetical protein HYE68_007430 [Fusarium pseudograminearum]
MFHLDPNNLTEDAWSHAKPRLPHYQHPVNQELFDMEPEVIKAAMYYDSCFKTDPELLPVHPNKEQETLCLERDGRKCVLTGESNIRIFYFIPITWNDTVDHNNATGMLKQASADLADINLVNAPDKICSIRELGSSHKAWNMLCVEDHLYDHLVKGLCAFRFMGYERMRGGKALTKLVFYWMPRLPELSNFDLDNETSFDMDSQHSRFTQEAVELIKRLDEYYGQGCPAMFEETSEIGMRIRSGQEVDIEMSKEDAEKFESAVKVHWACVLFTALCGGAGRAWGLTGMDLSDGSLQPRDHKFKADEQKKSLASGVEFSIPIR